uniref:G-protein coupled receptors family 1 profile domain-containing protein n=1 Tax=Anopheles atroparvus TaxID=41427 RepID=A0A182JG59_ANOAO
MQRTNYLLISIALIFGVSWLPLNLFNLFADIYVKAITEDIMVAYAICHMVGMSSACSNPLLYGWLNDNFRKEFNELLCRTPPSGATSGGGVGAGGGNSCVGSRANGGPTGCDRRGANQNAGGNGRLDGNGGPTDGRTAVETTKQVRDHYGAAMLQDSGNPSQSEAEVEEEAGVQQPLMEDEEGQKLCTMHRSISNDACPSTGDR